MATVSPHTIQIRIKRQSRGPRFVACIALQPPVRALNTVPLKMNFRTRQRYSVASGSANAGTVHRQGSEPRLETVKGQFADRDDAGRALADALAPYRGAPNLIVLALPRGGVPVARVVADVLNAPLDVVVVRKVGSPGNAEFAMGALASIAGTTVTVRNPEVLSRLGDEGERAFLRAVERERRELERRERQYRAGRGPLDVAGKTVILVDDGIATGATMRAALQALSSAHAAAVIVAVPVGPADTCAEIGALADTVVCVVTPEPFWAVGQAYRDFAQTSDDDVRRLLTR